MRDPFVKAAQKQELRSRAAFKLKVCPALSTV
jgi:23S rRNA U2552 (ribose-2'-O)-methylase RlmE/FtsJ